MRMHPKKHLPERLERCGALFITQTEGLRGNWGSAVFQNANPICVEIGCGKGNFITGLAQRHPDINYIAFEKYKNVLVTAMEKAQALNLTNVRFLSDDAANLEKLLLARRMRTDLSEFFRPMAQKPPCETPSDTSQFFGFIQNSAAVRWTNPFQDGQSKII